MKCLYCNKEISGNRLNEEKNQWHDLCVKKFFNTREFPLIDINKDKLKEILNSSISRGIAIPGVQKKFSLHLTSQSKKRLTLVNYPSGFILKPQTEEFENLPEYEHLTMLLAKLTTIKIVPAALIKINQEYAYLTRRVDRVVIDNHVFKLAMEDFQQLDLRLTEDKYKGSYERCGKIIAKYSSKKMYDLSEFYLRIIFSYITGNSDMHLKNFSLIEDAYQSRKFVLSPAYDLLPVNIITPSDKEETALSLNGKKKNITRNDLIAFANNIGLDKKLSNQLIDFITDKKEQLINCIKDYLYLSEDKKDKYIKLLETRINNIRK